MTIVEMASNLTPQLIVQTENWFVVSKPPGWLTVPGRGISQESTPVLVDWARAVTSSNLWVVHRLDLETSGLVVFARTAEDHRRANLWFQDRKVKKTYLCLAQGTPSFPFFKVNAPIAGAPSVTQIEVKHQYSLGFVAQIYPRTGRRHQIRIHLSSKGHPIWGDVTYGGARQVQIGRKSIEISRVALHALTLELPSGEKFEAPVPLDFENWMSELKAGDTTGENVGDVTGDV